MSAIRTARKSAPRRGTPAYASRKYFGRDQGLIAPKGAPIGVTPARPAPLGREALPHYWHPNRPGVEAPPAALAAQLRALSPLLRLTRPPARAPIAVHCWLLWMEKLSITHPLCPGWWLLMPWELDGKPLPLEPELLFAAIYHFDARHVPSAVAHFDRVIAERDHQRQRERAAYDNNRRAQQREFRDSLRISTAGRGNRFALHHDGTLMPSRGEVNWTLERQRLSQPSAVTRDEERRKDEERSL